MTSGFILVVEDNKEWQDSYEQWFTLKKHQVVIAGNKEDALASIAQHTFDVAIVDINLSVAHGNQDGLDIVSHLKANSPATRVIVVSGSVTPELVTELRQQGLDYIPRSELKYKEFVTFVQEKVDQAHSQK